MSNCVEQPYNLTKQNPAYQEKGVSAPYTQNTAPTPYKGNEQIKPEKRSTTKVEPKRSKLEVSVSNGFECNDEFSCEGCNHVN